MQPPRPSERLVPVDAHRIEALLAPVAAAHGLEICAVEWTTGSGGRILRVVIDRAASGADSADDGGAADSDVVVLGVSLEDCARVSREASTVLDAAEAIEGRYHLEVSSPGVDRPLETERDFRRNVGREAKVKLRSAAPDGQRVLRGPLLGVEAGRLRMRVDGNEHVVSLGEVAEARLVIDFGRHPKGGGGRRTKATRRRTPDKQARGAEARSTRPASSEGRSRPSTSHRQDGRS